MADAPCLPQVRYGRAILAPASWRLDVLGPSVTTPGDDEDFRRRLEDHRSRWDIPNEVIAVNADQRLLLNLDHPLHQELLRDELRRNPNLVITEQPGGGLGTARQRAREVVVSFTPRHRRQQPGFVARHLGERRRPGLIDDWLYLRVQCSRHTQNELLRNHLPQLVQLVKDAGCQRWFFIRYTDADGHHLRVRFRADRDRLWRDIAGPVGDLLRQWNDAGLIGEHSIHRFDPELERYGGIEAEDAATQVFQADSEAAIALLGLSRTTMPLQTLGAISVTSLADAFGSPAANALGVDAATYTGGSEGRTVPDAEIWLAMTGSRRELPSEYRRAAKKWQALLDPEAGWPGLGEHREAILDVLAPRDRAVRHYADVVGDLIASDRCPTPQARIIGSLLHMTCNRLFGGLTSQESTVLGLARGAVQDNTRNHRANHDVTIHEAMTYDALTGDGRTRDGRTHDGRTHDASTRDASHHDQR